MNRLSLAAAVFCFGSGILLCVNVAVVRDSPYYSINFFLATLDFGLAALNTYLGLGE